MAFEAQVAEYLYHLFLCKLEPQLSLYPALPVLPASIVGECQWMASVIYEAFTHPIQSSQFTSTIQHWHFSPSNVEDAPDEDDPFLEDEEGDGDEHEIWEDEEDDVEEWKSVTELHHLLTNAELLAPLSTKGNGRNFTIVNVSGIHEVVVHFCNCGKRKLEFLQLLDLVIYPGSVKRPKKGFTFQVLDNFTSITWNVKPMLGNTTKPFSRRPSRRFHIWPKEFMHVVCQWRYLKVMKWHGFGHGLVRVVGPGDLALWCAACPQPGINLPSDWKDNGKSYLYTRIINLDGNMKAEQMVQKYINVPLMEGGGFMVGDQDYKASIRASIDNPPGGTCHNHQAVTQGNMGSKNLQVTGIGAAACGDTGLSALIPS
ncbi:hypothetical protein JAAARDRAFT_197087 [Jaapia argillacea MUCL 33604]|uniref:CxC2-like cysteine cluster KDZ transposase-associated domain-containing protein n=1 Tax=Jaapia argillacea MUCL 33604 TaxID=933084 RepID=A0A067PGU5_9AGAM|nr:hypothetical protein JAAARDRAFT_197087 [Jaapia argillacea MUCL 33604]